MTERTYGRPFQPGQSGNLKGRPKGALNKKTLLLQQLCEENAEAVWGIIIQKALEGEPAALRIFADRTLPPQRGRIISFDCPELNGAEDIPSLIQATVNAVANGQLSIEHGMAFLQFLQEGQKSLQRFPQSPDNDNTKTIDATSEMIPVQFFAEPLKQLETSIGYGSRAFDKPVPDEAYENSQTKEKKA